MTLIDINERVNEVGSMYRSKLIPGLIEVKISEKLATVSKPPSQLSR